MGVPSSMDNFVATFRSIWVSQYLDGPVNIYKIYIFLFQGPMGI